MRRLALTLLAALSLAPAGVAEAATPTTTTKLTLTAPSFLTGTRTQTATTPARTTSTTTPARTTSTTTPASASSTTTTVLPSGNLPYTGDNLLPEAIGAVVLVGAGVGIRLRQRWR